MARLPLLVTLALAVAVPLAVAWPLAAGAPQGAAFAQSLSRLHVRSFTLATDRTSVREGEPFHLTISAHVDEPVLELDNVVLPDLSGFESLGDERRCSASSRGSDCVEILTLDGTAAGRRTIGPVTLDAVDARSGKPSRFATNTVDVTVEGASGMSGAARNLLAGLLVGIAAMALWWGFARRARRGVPQQPVASPAPPPVPPPMSPSAPPVASLGPDARLKELVAALEREPTRARAIAVRDELRARAGARTDETFGDLERRGALRDRPDMLSGLRAVEHAVFCEDARVESAAREALPFLTR